VVLVFFLVVPLVVGYMEHKVLAHAQSRLGPMYAGRFHGWAQLVADGVKFVQKEDVIPRAADSWVFSLAPGVAMIPYIAIIVVIPFSDRIFALNLDVGIFFVMAMGSVSVIGVLMAGWASANKFSLMGALRAAAQLIAYELPLVLAAASVVMQAATLSLVGIVEAQDRYWFVLTQPIGFFIFLTASVAELTRPPFDMPVADSEIIFGAYTENAVREFQRNVGLPPDGIAGQGTVRALQALRHIWEGKDPTSHSAARTASVRACEGLSRVTLAVGGLDDDGCLVAERLANLALAGNPDAQMRVVSAGETPTPGTGATVWICGHGTASAVPGRPVVRLDAPETLASRLLAAVASARSECPELVFELGGSGAADELDQQRAAVRLLDAICSVFD